MLLTDSELLEALERLGLVDGARIPELKEARRKGTRTLPEILTDKNLVTEAQIDVARRFAAINPLSAGAGFAKYRLGKELGRGGMGVVYEAEDQTLGRRVALKIFAGAGELERFEQEARLLARLRHPGIVTIYDFGSENSIPFIAMELIDGQPLDEVIAGMCRRAKPSPLSDRLRDDLRARVEIVRGVAEAVHAAHAAGVIHRDVKPGNVLIDPALRPHVTDFGLAREVAARTRLTADGSTLGTPAYMAPEQARGEAVEAPADIYGLGVILYELLTLRPPFEGSSIPMLIMQVSDDEPRSPSSLVPGLDRALEAVCLKAISKRPSARYATAQDLALDLGRWLAGESVLARPPGVADSTLRFLRRRGLLVGGAAAVMAVIVLLALLVSRPAYLEYELATPGAVVEVDGRAVATGARLKPGPHRVVVRLDGFRTLDETLTFTAGQTVARRFELVRPAGQMQIKPLPDGLHLRLRGPDLSYDGVTPWGPTSVPPGRYEIEIWGPGRSRVVMGIDIADRATWSMTETLPSAVWWSRETAEMDETPVLIDVNGDGVPDLFVPAKDGRLHALSGKTGDVLWSVSLGAPRATDPGLVFTAPGGGPAIAQGMNDGRLFVFDAKSGSLLCGFQMRSTVYAANRFKDLTGDGLDELLFATNDATIGCVEPVKGSPPRLPWIKTHDGEIAYSAPLYVELPRRGRRSSSRRAMRSTCTSRLTAACAAGLSCGRVRRRCSRRMSTDRRGRRRSSAAAMER